MVGQITNFTSSSATLRSSARESTIHYSNSSLIINEANPRTCRQNPCIKLRPWVPSTST